MYFFRALHKPSGRRRRNEIPLPAAQNFVIRYLDAGLDNCLCHDRKIRRFLRRRPRALRGAGAPCLVPRLREPFGLASWLREPAASTGQR